MELKEIKDLLDIDSIEEVKINPHDCGEIAGWEIDKEEVKRDCSAFVNESIYHTLDLKLAEWAAADLFNSIREGQNYLAEMRRHEAKIEDEIVEANKQYNQLVKTIQEMRKCQKEIGKVLKEVE